MRNVVHGNKVLKDEIINYVLEALLTSRRNELRITV